MNGIKDSASTDLLQAGKDKVAYEVAVCLVALLAVTPGCAQVKPDYFPQKGAPSTVTYVDPKTGQNAPLISKETWISQTNLSLLIPLP